MINYNNYKNNHKEKPYFEIYKKTCFTSSFTLAIADC